MKESEFEENYLYNKKKREKLNININQLYTPISYSKKIPLSGQNKVKDNNIVNKINYIYDSNESNFKNNNNYANFRAKNSNNINLYNSKTNINNKNKKKIIYKNNNMANRRKVLCSDLRWKHWMKAPPPGSDIQAARQL